MTRTEAREAVRKAAERHGFETGKVVGWTGFPDIISGELNFTLTTEATENTDWREGRIEEKLNITASVRKMGGSPTAEELLKTADEIRRGAELLKELQAMDLTYTFRI